MKRTTYLTEIENIIKSSNRGDVFVNSDFSEIADSQIIRKSLSRIARDNVIRRILHGVYEYPEYSNFLKEYIAPDPDKIAHALARNYGWTIVPCGDTALNLLGLSTQVPAVWSYVSDGTYKDYEYDKVKLIFKKTTNREISKISYKTALVIQALKALGKENINDKAIKKISSQLSEKEKTQMFSEAKYSTAWIYDIIKVICK